MEFLTHLSSGNIKISLLQIDNFSPSVPNTCPNFGVISVCLFIYSLLLFVCLLFCFFVVVFFLVGEGGGTTGSKFVPSIKDILREICISGRAKDGVG